MEQTQDTDDTCQLVLLGPGDVVVNITNNNSLERLPDLGDYLVSYDVEKAVTAGAGREGGRGGWPGTRQVRPKPLYQARESSLVPLSLLTVHFLQKT